MPLLDGDLFAGYRIQRLLGSGGMGEVYLAAHPRLPRLDALKILPARLTQDAQFRERFNREAELAATLFHAHIVGVHDRGEFDGQLWISMDFVDGTDAARLLRSRPGGLDVGEVFDIVDAVADALDFAHQRRLLHRDVKPANILLTQPVAGRRRILLADFGIARAFDDPGGLTSTNTAVGTASYSAPEQLMGQELDGRCDQYALAATAFQLLTSRAPFVDTNPNVVIAQHLNAPPPRISELRGDLAALDHVFATALAKQRTDRYPSCLAFAAALRAAHASPYPPPPPYWSPPSPPSPRPNRVLAVVVPVVLLLALAGAAVFALRATPPRPAAPPPPVASTEAPSWQPFVDAAKQGAINLSAIDYRTIDADVKRLLDTSTGDLRDDFGRTADTFKQTVREARSVSKGTVGAAGLETLKGDTGVVLVAVTIITTTGDDPPQAPRNWRMRVTVEHQGDAYKPSNVEFVP